LILPQQFFAVVNTCGRKYIIFEVVWKSIDWSRKTENGITAFRYTTGKRLGIFSADECFYLTKVE